MDDAAIFRISNDIAIVQTVDFFPPIVDDPYQFGAIAVANALSDVYTMGGHPLTALNVLCYPVDANRDVLTQILLGGYSKANEAGVLIVGGHTIDDAEPKYGLSVTGIVHPGKFVTISKAQPGDSLVLTKPIGTGVITTAAKNDSVDGIILQQAIESMLQLNQAGSEAMMQVGATACTDITGFGLLGHLLNMVKASNVSATINLSRVPILPGTLDLLKQGIAPGGTHRNLSAIEANVSWTSDITLEERLLLCDAQTSGGLLIAIPKSQLPELISKLKQAGIAEQAIIGEITEKQTSAITVTL
jgi:selenide,water dikinase